MRQSRFAIIMVSSLVAGLLGVYWIATGQEGRTPWPPPPVKLDDGGGERTTVGPPVPPPVPSSGTMPPAPVDPKGAPVDRKTSAVRKWQVQVLPEAPKARVCGVGMTEDSGLQQVSHQETDVPKADPPTPPPIPPMLTVPAVEPKAVPAPIMPDAPPAISPMSPVRPTTAVRRRTAWAVCRRCRLPIRRGPIRASPSSTTQ